MAIQDFTTWLETDPNNRITVDPATPTEATHRDITRTESAYLYSDQGAGGLADIIVEAEVSPWSTGYWIGCVLGVSNTVGDAYAWLSGIRVLFSRPVGRNGVFTLEEIGGTKAQWTQTQNLQEVFFIRFTRQAGQAVLELYTDAARTSLAGRVSIPASSQGYRYIYALASYNDGLEPTRKSYASYIRDMDLGEPSPPPPDEEDPLVAQPVPDKTRPMETETVRWGLAASDNVALGNYEVLLDVGAGAQVIDSGTLTGAEWTGYILTGPGTTHPHSLGVNTLAFRVWDAAGNGPVQASASIEVRESGPIRVEGPINGPRTATINYLEPLTVNGGPAECSIGGRTVPVQGVKIRIVFRGTDNPVDPSVVATTGTNGMWSTTIPWDSIVDQGMAPPRGQTQVTWDLDYSWEDQRFFYEPPGEGGTVAQYLASQHNGTHYFPPQNPGYSGLFWNSYGAAAAAVARVPNPSGIDAWIRSDISTNALNVWQSHVACIACAEMGVSMPSVASTLQGQTNPWGIKEHGCDYNLGMDWDYKRVHALYLLGATPNNRSSLRSAILAAQGLDGGWEGIPMGQNMTGLTGFREQDSCVWRTHHAVMMLVMMAYASEPAVQQGADWLVAQQNNDGGWGYSRGHLSFLEETWYGVEALVAAGRSIPGTVSGFVHSCQNQDGGFGDRPGWSSRLEATYYALKILEALGEDLNPVGTVPVEVPAWMQDMTLNMYTMCIEAYLSGDPAGSVADYAHQRGIHIVGCINGQPGSYNSYAQSHGLDTSAIYSPESDSGKLQLNGYHWRTHIGDGANADVYCPYTPGAEIGVPWSTFAANNPRSNAIAMFSQDWFLQYHWGTDALDLSEEGGGYNGMIGMGISHTDLVVATRDNLHAWWMDKFFDRVPTIRNMDIHRAWNDDGIAKAYHGMTFFLAHGRTWSDFMDAARNGRVALGTDQGLLWGNRYACQYIRQRWPNWSLPAP